MMVGHAMLAFAVAAAAAARLGRDRRSALSVGVVAALFAALPDVDMLYALVGVLQWTASGPSASIGTGVWLATEAFWSSSTLVHRAVTHSIVVAVPAAIAFTWATGDRLRRLGALALLGLLVASAYVTSGPLGGAIMLAFATLGVALSQAVADRTGLSTRTRLAAALFGLLSHPFGDLFTGTPPHLLYPLDATLVSQRVALLPDPTLNLIAVFALELATIWLALAVYTGSDGRRIRPYVHARSSAGAAYAIAAVALPAPTLTVSYHFVFSVLAVGLVGMTPRSRPLSRPTLDADTVLEATFTAIAAISLATVAYTAVYLVY